MWAEVSTCAPHLLHNGLPDCPIWWKCLLRVLCPVRRPVTALDTILLKGRSLALTPRQGPEISSPVRLWVSPRPRPVHRLVLPDIRTCLVHTLFLWWSWWNHIVAPGLIMNKMCYVAKIPALYRKYLTQLLYVPLMAHISTGWHKKTGTFEKPNKNWRNPRKKNLLTEIEPLQLAF